MIGTRFNTQSKGSVENRRWNARMMTGREHSFLLILWSRKKSHLQESYRRSLHHQCPDGLWGERLFVGWWLKKSIFDSREEIVYNPRSLSVSLYVRCYQRSYDSKISFESCQRARSAQDDKKIAICHKPENGKLNGKKLTIFLRGIYRWWVFVTVAIQWQFGDKYQFRGSLVTNSNSVAILWQFLKLSAVAKSWQLFYARSGYQ